MSQFVDYAQTTEHHESLLVLVQHIGSQLQTPSFHRAMEKICRVERIHVQGQKRNISIRYRKTYSVDFNSWGDFQAHRKVLGLIAVGKCTDHAEFGDLFTSYKSTKEEYASTIINSRLIVFGMNTDGSPISDKVNDNGNETDDAQKVESYSESNHCEAYDKVKSLCPTELSSSPVTSPTESSQRVVKGDDSNIGSSPGKANGVNSAGVDSLSNAVQRQHSNSLTKEGSGAEVVFYPNVDKCADLEDRMKEFVTSLYYVLEGKRLDRSFERSDKLTLLCAPFEKKDYIGVDTDTKSFRKKCMGRLRKHLGDLCLQAAMPGEAVLHYNTALDLLRSVNDFLWMGACFEGLCCAAVILAYPKASPIGLRRNLSFQTKRGSAVNEAKARAGSSYANGLDTLADSSSQSGPNPEDVVEKYKEAITYYSKFKNAAMVEMEACFKACRFLISQRKYLHASDFLKNVVYINLPSQEDDKIQRYDTLSALYSQIGFRRKAAFFKRVSGMHCVVPDTTPSWSQCYDLLLQALEGYNLSVNPREMDTDHTAGWPVLQYRVLHELVYSARRMSNPQIAVRHMTLLVHTMLRHLNVNDQREALTALATLTLKCPGTPQPLALDSGLILPPIPLLYLPTIRSFRLLAPSPHLQATKMDSAESSSSSGVFIYTPLSLGSKTANNSKPDFKWVCGDVCEASLQLTNPLVDELNMFYMGLMTSDLDTEIFPASPVIPPNSGMMTVKLLVKPKATGTLRVLGYTTIVYGVTSNCRLRDLTHLRPSPMTEIAVEVIPALPQVALSCSLPKSTVFSSMTNTADVVATGAATLFAGQSTECVVTIQNISDQPVEKLSVKINSKSDMQNSLSRMVSWSEENIQSQLPLQPNCQLCFTICLYGDSDFLVPSGQTSQSLMSQRWKADSVDVQDKGLDVVLALQYSGGQGMEAGYCRQCSLAINLDVLPSVVISRWDVQHMDDPQQCRLRLDLVNASNHQMDIAYDQDRSIILEPKQTRRIGVDVPCLQLTQVDTNLTQENRIPAHYKMKNSPDPFSQCLANYVDIRWNMSAAKVGGAVAINYLKWTSEQLDVILSSDVRWEVKLNGKPCLPSSRLRVSVGKATEVDVLLENTTEVDMPESILRVETSQVTVEGDLGMTDVNQVVIGSASLHIPQIIARAAVRHTCSFIFFTPGSYGLIICCNRIVRSPPPENEPVQTKKDSGSLESKSTGNNVRPSSITSTAGVPTSEGGSSWIPSQHTKWRWVCSLPIRFEVT